MLVSLDAELVPILNTEDVGAVELNIVGELD
jgi:hypothetical protein